MSDATGQPTVVVSGSFRRHFDGVREAIRKFQTLDVKVLSPAPSRVAMEREGFAVLESDDTEDVRVLESRHLLAISRATGLYVFDPDGYVGLSTSLEIGWGMALEKPIFAYEDINDITLRSFCGSIDSELPIRVATVDQATSVLKILDQSPISRLRPNLSLLQLQEYVSRAAIERGFADETLLEILVLMTEELGELARQVRRLSGIKTRRQAASASPSVAHETADLLFYILHLANASGVDLFQAFAAVEKENSHRTWVSLPRKT